MNIFALFFSLLMACSVSSNKQVESENSLLQFVENKDSLFILLSKNDKAIIFTQTDTIPFYLEGSVSSNFTDSMYMKRVEISSKFDVNLFTYYYTPSNYKMNHKEYIKVNDLLISLDSLLKLDYNKIIEKDPYIYWRNISFFKMGDHDYILLQGQSRNIYMHEGVISYLLFDFVKNHFQNVWLFYNGYFQKSVFNDFNGDGNLDYLSWGLNMENINLYHLNKELVKDSFYHLRVKPNKNQFENGQNNILDWYTDIDKNASIWFKNLVTIQPPTTKE
jgi:hypothetical protein